MESRLVLILHPDDSVRRALREGIQPLPVIEACSRQEAVDVLSRVQPMFVVMHHEGARKVLRDIERHAPGTVRVVLCPDELEAKRELLEVAEGLEFATVPLGALEQLRGALQIRTSARLSPHRRLEARFVASGRELKGSVVEVGSDGLAIALENEVPVELLQPGVTLTQAQVVGMGGQQVLEPRSWVVRSLSHPRLSSARLGVSFLRQRDGVDARVAATDPIRVGALVYRAARRGARFSLRAISEQAPYTFAHGEPDAAFETVALDGPATPFRAGDIVQLGFELSGRSYSGMAVVRGEGPRGPVVVLPRTLYLGHRRHSLRIRLQAPHRATLTWVSPITGEVYEKELVSMHPGGAAFLFNAAQEAFPDGLILSGALLHFLGREFPLRVSVQSSSIASPLEPLTRRCGLKLEVASNEGRQVLLDALISVRQPEVVDGSKVDFALLWKLFQASAVHFPDYPPGPGPHLEVLERARLSLGDGRSGLGKSLVWRSDDGVDAHCGGLRIYSRNWFTQHLVVRPAYRRQSHVSEQMVNLMVDYAEALDDVDFLSAFWRAENRFMARVCGAVARKLAGTGLVNVSTFQRLRCPLPPELPPGPVARDADASDRETLLAHLRTTHDPLWLRSHDLVPGELELETLAGRYGRSGLIRRRQIGAATSGRGWALLEEMTPGLFWAELHSGFRLVLREPAAFDADEVRLELLRWVNANLRPRVRQVGECLAEPGDVPLLSRLGFADLGGAIELTLHREAGRQWSEELLSMFERFSVPRGRASESSATSDAAGAPE